MSGPLERPRPEETRPPITPAGHAWRLGVCLLISAAAWSQAIGPEWRDDRWIFAGEVVLGLIAYGLVVLRRRAPITIALTVAALSTLSGIAAGPATLAAVSVATLRRPWPIVAVGLVNFACATAYSFYAPFELTDPIWVTVAINVVINGAMMGWGMFIGSRRELLWTLHQRAIRAEAEQELRVGQGRSKERERIAREMHDVLAHRITQVSMQAGALAFRDDLTAPQLREGLGEIQGKANEAIHELRGVLGVLRDRTTGALVDAPQPTYADVAGLVAESRAHGLSIDFDDDVDSSEQPVPDAVGRAVYRIVQEALTNATKHAPGAHVTVRIDGAPERGVDVVVSNRLGFGSARAAGAGLGLVGLTERAELRGGILTHGREGKLFVLRGSIPWTP